MKKEKSFVQTKKKAAKTRRSNRVAIEPSPLPRFSIPPEPFKLHAPPTPQGSKKRKDLS